MQIQNVSEIIKSGRKQLIDISAVTVPLYHDRTDVDDETIESLTNNMFEVGQINPVLVEKVSENHYELISGLRRLSAAQKLNWSEIDAVVLENLDDNSRILIMIAENAQREDINDYDLVVSLIHYLAVSTAKDDEEIKSFLYKLRNMDSGNVKNISYDEKKLKQQLEEALSRTDKYSLKNIINKLKVLNFHPELIKAMKENKILYSYALLLNKIPDELVMLELLSKFTKKLIDKAELKKEARNHIPQSNKIIPFADIFKKLRDFESFSDKVRQSIQQKMEEIEKLLAS